VKYEVIGKARRRFDGDFGDSSEAFVSMARMALSDVK
jgi:hypothetical protein